MNHCPNCGSPINDLSAKFCNNCGKSFLDNSELQKANGATTPFWKKRNFIIVFAGVLTLLTLGILVFVLVGNPTQSDKPTVDKPRMMYSQFYKDIGLTKSAIVNKYGTPDEDDTVAHSVYYDEMSSTPWKYGTNYRRLYMFQKDVVVAASYVQLELVGHFAESAIQEVNSEFEAFHFRRIPDNSSVIFTDGYYDILVLTVQNNSGTFNLALTAGLHKNK